MLVVINIDSLMRGKVVWFPSKYCHGVWHGNLEWCGYPTVKNFEDMFIFLDNFRQLKNVTDRRTDGSTDTS